METNSQEYWDWRYRRLVPATFQRPSGVLGNRFRTLDPHQYSYIAYRDSDGVTRQIDEAACCSLLFRGRYRTLLLPISEDKQLFEAVLFLGEAFRRGNRVNRYLALYRAYESIAKVRNQEFSAVRHALSHSSKALKQASTLDVLQKAFGGTYINLRLHSHQGEFFSRFGRMLIETDKLIHDAILRQFPVWVRLDSLQQLRGDYPVGPSNHRVKPTSAKVLWQNLRHCAAAAEPRR